MPSSGQTQPITTLQLIVSVITLTTGAFLVPTLFLAPLAPLSEGQTSLTPILLTVAAVMLAMGFVANRSFEMKFLSSSAAWRETAIEQVRGGHAPAELAARTIIHAASGQGLALIGTIAYLLEAQSLALIPVGLGLAWVAVSFPTRERLLSRVTEPQA